MTKAGWSPLATGGEIPQLGCWFQNAQVGTLIDFSLSIKGTHFMCSPSIISSPTPHKLTREMDYLIFTSGSKSLAVRTGFTHSSSFL